MIGKQDILDRATEWQLRPEVVEKDYIIGWVLASLASPPEMRVGWILKSGMHGRYSVRGLILIGRKRNLDPTTNDRRRQLGQDLQIDIHTYDWVARGSIGRIEALERSRIEYQDG
jgi:hypothetical protein